MPTLPRGGELDIPPLAPTEYVGFDGFVHHIQLLDQAPPHQPDVIFRLTAQQYLLRMEHEAHRLQREHHLERTLEEKTRIIERLTDQVKRLQMMRLPTIAALRQAYAEDKISQEEFERLLLYVIGGES